MRGENKGRKEKRSDLEESREKQRRVKKTKNNRKQEPFGTI